MGGGRRVRLEGRRPEGAERTCFLRPGCRRRDCQAGTKPAILYGRVAAFQVLGCRGSTGKYCELGGLVFRNGRVWRPCHACRFVDSVGFLENGACLRKTAFISLNVKSHPHTRVSGTYQLYNLSRPYHFICPHPASGYQSRFRCFSNPKYGQQERGFHISRTCT